MIHPRVFGEIYFNPELPQLFENSFDYHDLITWEQIENYLNNEFQISAHQLRILDETGEPEDLNLVDYIWDVHPRISTGEVFYKINSGRTFIIENFSKFNKKLNFLSSLIHENFDDIDLDFHLFAGLNSEGKSFGIHKDRSYNLILQIEGNCHWKVYKKTNSVDDWNLENDFGLELHIEHIMNPGDLLYIPKGLYHECIPLGKRISISSCYTDLMEECSRPDRNWYSLNYK